MNPFDAAATAAVWARVRGEEQGASLPVALLALLSDERTERSTYLRLTRFRAGAPVFRTLAREEGCHAQRLAVLYFLLTGQTACAQTGAVPCYRCLSEALRDRFAQEQKSVQAYRAAADRWPEHAAFFSALAAREQSHAAALLRLTQNILS